MDVLVSREIAKKIKAKPKRIIARIRECNGGKHGRTGESVAIVEPEYFPDGDIKLSTFKRIETIRVIKVPYSRKGSKYSEHIIELIDVLEEKTHDKSKKKKKIIIAD